jgi:hypothetical protein
LADAGLSIVSTVTVSEEYTLLRIARPVAVSIVTNPFSTVDGIAGRPQAFQADSNEKGDQARSGQCCRENPYSAAPLVHISRPLNAAEQPDRVRPSYSMRGSMPKSSASAEGDVPSAPNLGRAFSWLKET